MRDIFYNRCRFDLYLFSKYRIELMGISAIGILLCHASGRGVEMPLMIERILHFGNIGVDIFLLLSGISMYYSLGNEKVINLRYWYIKRFLRIGIPYLIISTPVWVFYCIVEHKGVQWFFYYWSTIAFWTEHYGAWFVALLIPLYLITPFIASVIENANHRLVPVIAIVFIACSLSILPVLFTNGLLRSIWENIAFVLCRIPIFIVGYWLGPFVQKKRTIPYISVFFLIFLYYILKFIPVINMVYRNGLLAFAFAAILCSVLSRVNEMGILRRVLLQFGIISLESYLANVYLGYLSGRFSWRFGNIDLSRGNRISYAFVLLFGTIVAYYTNKATKKLRAGLLEINK